MKEEYLNNIEAHKAVLSALPQNNAKNIKAYQEKVSSLLEEYTTDMSLLEEEISKRNKYYLSISLNEEIPKTEASIKDLKPKIPLINPYNSPYEKSGLDIILYKLGHYYTIDLDAVNDNIASALNIFKKVGINLTIDSFSYSYYAKKYLEKLLSLDPKKDTYQEELKQSFESIYWSCPDIINHITLNFKYLYYQNEKKFITYYESLSEELISQNILSSYKALIIKRDNLISDSKYLLLERFLNNELSPNDYNKTKISKLTEELISPEDYQEEDIINLNHTPKEYSSYMSLGYLITDIKTLIADKSKYKGIYQKKHKEISKKEKELFKENNKIIKLMTKNNPKKFAYYNNLINNNITILKDMYEELEKNYFLEKLATLNDDITVLDILTLASSNYNYLIELYKKLTKEPDIELSKLFDLITYPYINLLNNIWLKDEKDLSLIIIDKYNLYGFKLTKEMLSPDSIDSLITNLNQIIISDSLKKHNLDEAKIKFIKESQSIVNNYAN